MSSKNKQVCALWQVSKCFAGDKCTNAHAGQIKYINFGDCLKFLQGITHCKYGQQCLRSHIFKEKYSMNPCKKYVAGFCKEGWKCQEGDHCALTAVTEQFLNKGIHPPEYFESSIESVDRRWSNLMNIPINRIKLFNPISYKLRENLGLASDAISQLTNIIMDYAINSEYEKHNEYIYGSIIHETKLCKRVRYYTSDNKREYRSTCCFCRNILTSNFTLTCISSNYKIALTCTDCLNLDVDNFSPQNLHDALDFLNLSREDTILYSRPVRHMKTSIDCIYKIEWYRGVLILDHYSGGCDICKKNKRIIRLGQKLAQ
jgi:hypothetical protein